jgi:type II secretory pathway component PulC
MIRPRRFAVVGLVASGAAILATAAFLHRPPPAAPGPVVTKEVSPRRWDVSRADRDAYLADPARVNREVLLRPIPGTEPDSIQELRIARLSPDGPIYAAGFREGDRILRIDGAPVSRLSDAVNLVHRIRTAVRLTVDVDRDGKEFHHQFEFR